MKKVLTAFLLVALAIFYVNIFVPQPNAKLETTFDPLIIEYEGDNVFSGTISTDSTVYIKGKTTLTIQGTIESPRISICAPSVVIGANANLKATESIHIGSAEDFGIVCHNLDVDPKALIVAGGVDRFHDGGNIRLVSGGLTDFKGTILACGSAYGGDGGFVEISGHSVNLKGKVSTLAPFGKTGRLLIDPTNIHISNLLTTNINETAGNFTGTASTANIDVSDLISVLSSNNVTVNTASIYFGSGDITLINDVVYNSPNSLDFIADQNILINALLVNQGSGDINFNALGDVYIGDPLGIGGRAQVGSYQGDISFTVGNDLIVTGGGSADAYAQIGTEGDSINSNMVFAVGRDVKLIGGNLADRAHALIGHGAYLSKGGVKSGNITFNAIGRDLILQGGVGVGTLAFAQIGHLPANTDDGTINNTISFLSIVNDVIITGGTNNFNRAIIGHAGQNLNFSGTINGNISLSANSIQVVSGIGAMCEAAIGLVELTTNRSPLTVNYGAIAVSSATSITLIGQEYSPAIIGCNINSYNETSATVDLGTITLSATQDLIMEGAFLGCFVSRGTGAADLSVNLGRDLLINATSVRSKIRNGLGTSVGPHPLSLIIGRFFDCNSGAFSHCEIFSIDSTLISSANNILVNQGAFTEFSLLSQNGINLLSSGSLTINQVANNANAFLCNASGDFDASILGSINVNNFTAIENFGASNGDIQWVSNVDFFLADDTRVVNYGSGSLTLVCDNAFANPTIGPGTFVLSTGSALSTTGGGLRIFTATIPQTTLNGTLNGIPFFSSPPTEQNFTYFPNLFGGIPFTVFYKN